MSIEDRLRAAIAKRTSTVEPSPDGLHRIEEKLMESQHDTNRNRLLMGLASAAAVVALVVGAVALMDGDDDEGLDVADTTTTESTETTETTEPDDTTTTTTFTSPVDPALALWPLVHTSQRFDDPVTAAHSFAVDFVGFTDPVMGDFQQGDNRSGEVPVRPTADGPVTIVLVRQLEDDTWFVIAAETETITLDEPAAGEDIDCPVRLTGDALAFEGHVDVAVHADMIQEPIGTGFVTGGGSPPGAPFDGEVECDMSGLGTSAHYGAIVLTTEGGEDGRVWQALVRRVQLKAEGEAP